MYIIYIQSLSLARYVQPRGNGLGDARNAQLEAIGFEWVSTRKCGSAFMENFRELRSYWEQHGTTEVAADGVVELAEAAGAEVGRAVAGLL